MAPFRTKDDLGFTLIELMVTIAIIAILAAVGLVVYSTAQKSGRISKRAQDLDALKTALVIYRSSNPSYPATFAPGGTVNYNPVETNLGVLVPAYMPMLPADPLGSTYPYRYASDGVDYKIITNPSIPSSGEMSAEQFNTIPNLVDPGRDQNGSTCSVETGANVAGWAVYTSGACLW